MPPFTRLALLMLVGIAMLSACAGRAGDAGTDVRITLTDFGVQSSLVEFQAGTPYTFTITNEGLVPHEFMFIPPVAASTHDMHGEAVHATALIQVEESELPPGAVYTLLYTFPQSIAGTDLEIACHTPGHYEAGMRLPITVH